MSIDIVAWKTICIFVSYCINESVSCYCSTVSVSVSVGGHAVLRVCFDKIIYRLRPV